MPNKKKGDDLGESKLFFLSWYLYLTFMLKIDKVRTMELDHRIGQNIKMLEELILL